MITDKNWFQLRPMYSYIRKQAENEKFLKYLEVGATFFLIAIFLFFAIMPTITTISSLIGEIKSKETQIDKMTSKISNIIKAQENYAKVQDQYSLIEDSFPSLPRYYNGATNLATAFRDSSVGINQVSFNLDDSSAVNSFFKTYQIDISGQGSYSSIMAMVQKLFNNRRLIETTDIQFGQIDTNTDTGSVIINVNLSGKLYFLSNQ